MNYMGGKMRQGKAIANAVAAVAGDKDYYEPFCGAMGAAMATLSHPKFSGGGAVLSDSCVPLIGMWKALMSGWAPPDVVTEETYQEVRRRADVDDPMFAYCGFGMSFGGKWWGGYARNGAGTDYALNASRSTLLKASVLLKACDYREVLPDDAVIYLDPPYAGRTKPHAYVGLFDHAAFWEHSRSLVKHNTVLVTEFTAPPDFVVLHSWGDTVVRHHATKGADGTNECIFVHESQRGLWE